MTVVATAVYASGDGGATYTLSGSSGSPNDCEDSAGIFSASAGWRFSTDGTVDQVRLNFPGDTQFQDGVEWTDEQDSPTGDHWIRADYNSGTSPTTGNTLNEWHKLTGTGGADVAWVWSTTSTITGSLIIRISTTNSDVGVVATGYYQGTAFVS